MNTNQFLAEEGMAPQPDQTAAARSFHFTRVDSSRRLRGLPSLWARSTWLVMLLALLIQTALSGAQAAVVYDNTHVYTNTLGGVLSHGTAGTELGDEITITGGASRVTQFSLDYVGLFTNRPNARAVVRFYLNDGVDSDPGPKVIRAPGTLLWESDEFGLISSATNRIQLTLAVPEIEVPRTFTWSVKFSNVGGSEVGLCLADGPGPGSSYDDFWEKAGGVWHGKQVGSPGVKNSFSARIEASVALPSLSIHHDASVGKVQIRWANTAPGCGLVGAAAASSTWTPVTETPVTDGADWVVTVDADHGSRLFRLGCQ